MTKQQERMMRLMPNGIPRWIRCYDNGGRSYDRYTVLFTGRWSGKPLGYFPYLALSEHPYSPMGFGQHGEHYRPCDANKHGWPPPVGGKNHLGKRITFEELPPDCKRAVLEDYKEIWNLEGVECPAAMITVTVP